MGDANGSVSVKHMECVVRTRSEEKSAGPDGFPSGIFQMLQEETTAPLESGGEGDTLQVVSRDRSKAR